jgi:ABC-type transport system substrate-binding protein
MIYRGKAMKIILILSLLLLTVGCGKKTQQNFLISDNERIYNINYDYKEDSPENIADIIFGVENFPKTFNPFKARTYTENLLVASLYSTLFLVDPKTEIPQPNLVKRYEISGDGLNYRLEILDNIRFSDGSTLSVKDIKKSFLLLESYLKNTELYNSFYIQNKTLNFKEIDEYNFELSIDVPNSNLLYALSKFPILKEKEIEDIKSYEDFIVSWSKNNIPTGSGPFVIESISKKNIALTRNPNYFKKNKNNIQYPYSDKIFLKTYENKNKMIIDFTNMECDLIKISCNEDFSNLYKYFENKEFVKIISTGFCENKIIVTYNCMNGYKNDMEDSALRGRISDIIARSLKNRYTILDTMMDDKKNEPSYYDKFKDINYDGYIEDGNMKNLSLNLVAFEENEDVKKIAQDIKKALLTEEFSINLELYPFYRFVEKIYYEKDFDIALINYKFNNSLEDFYSLFSKSDFTFYPFFDNSADLETINELLDNLLRTNKKEKQDRIKKRILELISKNQQFKPIFAEKNYYFINKNIDNFFIAKDSDYINLETIERIFKYK